VCEGPPGRDGCLVRVEPEEELACYEPAGTDGFSECLTLVGVIDTRNFNGKGVGLSVAEEA